MRIASITVVLAAFAMFGCAGNQGEPGAMPGSRSTDAPMVNSPQAPSVDQNMDAHNRTGDMGTNGNGSSPAGGDPQMGGH